MYCISSVEWGEYMSGDSFSLRSRILCDCLSGDRHARCNLLSVDIICTGATFAAWNHGIQSAIFPHVYKVEDILHMFELIRLACLKLIILKTPWKSLYTCLKPWTLVERTLLFVRDVTQWMMVKTNRTPVKVTKSVWFVGRKGCKKISIHSSITMLCFRYCINYQKHYWFLIKSLHAKNHGNGLFCVLCCDPTVLMASFILNPDFIHCPCVFLYYDSIAISQYIE